MPEPVSQEAREVEDDTLFRKIANIIWQVDEDGDCPESLFVECGTGWSPLAIAARKVIETFDEDRARFEQSIRRDEAEKCARQLEPIYHVLHCIYDECEDEGDRIYLGSTNDHHTLKRQLRQIEKLFLLGPAAIRARHAETEIGE